ncbi:MAG: response regulator transcription factor [Armatimonadota bacterium]|nr:response regulator transcription factor [Armatimonadota bacterium]
MDTIRILLADDHAVMRAGLALLVNAEPDMEVIGEASNGFEAITKAEELKPDVVVMDVTMPGIDGLEATRRIKDRLPNTRVLVLTIHEERRYLQQLLQIGASGYLVKRAEPSELIAAIRAVAHGQIAVHSSMLPYLAASAAEHAVPYKNNNLEKLTERERQVMDLLIHGYTNKEIAERLSVSKKTVETHRANLFAKLLVKTRAELVRYAIQTGELGNPP